MLKENNRFWENKRLDEMSMDEWESLCDRCGRCCLVSLQDEETEALVCTKLSCKQLDTETVTCRSYENRKQVVPSCMVLSMDTLSDSLAFSPSTCAYRLIYEGKPLYDWHPLISKSPNSVVEAGISVLGKVIPQTDVAEDDWEDYVVDCDTLSDADS